MTAHLDEPQEDFTKYMTDIQTPVNTWGESRNSKADTWY